MQRRGTSVTYRHRATQASKYNIAVVWPDGMPFERHCCLPPIAAARIAVDARTQPNSRYVSVNIRPGIFSRKAKMEAWVQERLTTQRGQVVTPWQQLHIS